MFETLTRRLAGLALATASLATVPAAQAANIEYFVPFAGAGNLSVFTPTTGGWVGSIDQVAPPVVANPLSLVSVVLFELDALAQTLTGTFEFTTTDLSSTLFGTLSGSFFDADILTTGGQFALDYTILGGTGMFGDAAGFGLSFLTFDPAGTFNNYSEDGLLSFGVPEPASLALVLGGLLLAGAARRQAPTAASA